MGIVENLKKIFIKDRAFSTYSVEAEFQKRLDASSRWLYAYTINYYVGDGEQYIIFVQQGVYYRTDVSFSNNEINFSEPYEVVIEYTAISRESISTKLYRDKDNNLKFIASASYATINRNDDEIDTTELFDSFEETFGTYEENPLFNVGHVHHEKFIIGNVEGVVREKNTLIAFGVIDETTPLGSLVEERIKEGGWGLSIEFMPLKIEHEVIDGKNIKKYTKGYFAGLALLREEKAASYFTAIEINRGIMGKDLNKAKSVLTDFLGDSTKVEEFLSDVELREKTAQEKGLTVRENEEVVEEEAAQNIVIEINDELVDEIVSKSVDKVLEKVNEQIRGLNETITNLNAEIERMQKNQEQFSDKLNNVEKEDKKKIEDAVSQMPLQRQMATVVVNRKTEQRAAANKTTVLEEIEKDPVAHRKAQVEKLKLANKQPVSAKID